MGSSVARRAGTSSAVVGRRVCVVGVLAAAFGGGCRKGGAGGEAGEAAAAVVERRVQGAAERVLEHVWSHGGPAEEESWEVKLVETFADVGIEVFEVRSAAGDAAGRSVIVAGEEVVCGEEADAFARVVRQAGGARRPGVLPPADWIALYLRATGTRGELVVSVADLGGLEERLGEEAFGAVSPPSFDAIDGGGFRFDFWYVESRVTGGPAFLRRVAVAVDGDGRVDAREEGAFEVEGG